MSDRMTREEQNRKLKAFITCLKCEVSGKSCDDNCPTQYEAGNMGEIIENLETISRALEQEQYYKDLAESYEKTINKLTKAIAEQEPFKPMVEIDLDYVIKQKYIEREVLDKIRAEIQKLRNCSCSCSDGIIDDIEDIIDKYKAENNS